MIMCSFLQLYFLANFGFHISQQQTETQPTNWFNFSSLYISQTMSQDRTVQRKSVHYCVFIHKIKRKIQIITLVFGCFPLPAQIICVSCSHLAHYGKCFSAPSVQASSSYQAPQQNTQRSFPFQPLAAMFHQNRTNTYVCDPNPV